MADKESQLRLKLTAQNDAEGAVKSVGEGLSQLVKTAEDAAKVINESFQAIIRAATSSAESMTKSSMDIGKSFEEGSKLVSDSSKAMAESMATLDRTFSDTVKVANESANSTGKAFSEEASAVESSVRSISEVLTSLDRTMSEQGNVSREMTQNMEQGFRGMSEAISASVMATRQGFSGLNDNMMVMGNNAEESGSRMRDSFSNAGLMVGLQMLGSSMEHVGEVGGHLFGEAVHQSADFQSSLSDTTTALYIMGTPLKQAQELTQQLGEKALDLGSHYHRSATEIASAMATLVRNGVSAKDAYNGVAQATVQVSLLTKSSLEETATVMSDVYNEFRDQFARNGKSIQQNMSDVSKSITGAMYSARVSMPQFLNTMQYVGNAAGVAGVNVKDMGLMIAIMARHAETGSRAGTALNMMITRMINPSKQGAAALKDLGIIQGNHNLLIDQATGKLKPFVEIQGLLHNAFEKLTPAQKASTAQLIFGQQHYQKLLPLIEATTKDVQDMQGKFDQINIEKAAGVQMNNLSGDLMLLHANWETFLKMVGNTLQPALRSMAQSLDKVVESATGFAKAHPEITKFGAALLGLGSVVAIAGGALLGLLATIGFIKEGLHGLNIIANPFNLLTRGAREAAAAERDLAIAETAATAATRGGMFASLGATLASAGAGIKGFGATLSALILGPWKLFGDGIKAMPALFANFGGILKTAGAAIGEFVVLGFTKIGEFTALLAKPLELANIGLYKGMMAFGEWSTSFFAGIAKLFTMEGALAALSAAGNTIRTILTAMTGPWGILIAVIIAAVGAIIANWDSIKNWVTQHFGGTIPTTWEGLKAKAVSIWNSIKQVFTDVWNNIKQVIDQAWHYIEPTIMRGVSAVHSFWIEVWPQIKQVFVEVWNVMKVLIAPALATIYTAISAALGFIKGAWQPAWELIKTTFKLVWDAIVGILRTAWDLVSGVIKIGLDLLTGNWSKAWTDLKQTVSNVWHDIWSFLGTVLNDAVQWGANFVKMIANGISGAASGVVDAVKNIAGTIKSFLGFHSPTEEGPASDSHKWAPNFIDMFVDGIDSNKHLLEDSVHSVAQTMADYLGFHSPTNLGPGSDANTWAPNFVDMFSQGLTNGSAKVQEAATKLITPLVDTVKTSMDNAKSTIESGVTSITDSISKMKDDITNSINALSDSLKQASTDMQNAMTTAFDSIAQKAEDASKRIVTAMQQAQQAMTSMSTMGVTGGGGGGSHVIDSSGNMSTPSASGLNNTNIGSDGLTDYSRSARDDAISNGGQTADHFSFLADGGIVTRPTKAIIGENGEPEYVIPKSKMDAGIMELPSFKNSNRGVIQNNITINVNGVGKDGNQLASTIANMVRQQIPINI